MMGDVFLNFCILIAFALILILGYILIISGVNTLRKLINKLCNEYPTELEYFDTIINKEDKDNV